MWHALKPGLLFHCKNSDGLPVAAVQMWEMSVLNSRFELVECTMRTTVRDIGAVEGSEELLLEGCLVSGE